MRLFLLFLFSVSSGFVISLLNDVHLELNYDPTVTHKARCQPGMAKDPTVAFYGRHGCDSPYLLLVATLEKMKAINPSPNFILASGDIVAHSIPRLDGLFTLTSYEAVKETIANFTATLASYFPDVPIVFTQGNDDYAINYQVPDHAHREDYYGFVYNKTIAEIKANNISDTMENKEMFTRTGCYITILPEGFMVISLNAMHFSVRNRPENDPEAPTIIFNWLEQKLQQAAKEELKVILTYHIPHGTFLTPLGIETFWVNKHEMNLRNVLSKHVDIIAGIFTGHMHLSNLNASFYQVEEKKNYYAGVVVNRAVSPVYNNNPGFALFYYVDSMDHPKYFEEYTLLLKNAYNKTESPDEHWIYLYHSLKDLQIEEVSSEGIYKFVDNAKKYLKKHLQYTVLRLGISMSNYQEVGPLIIKVCMDGTTDPATYHMCVDSLNEYVRDNY